jgi:hypothetical protein
VNFQATFKQPTQAGVITFVTLQFVSQAAHVGFGFIFVIMPALLVGQKAMWWAAGALAIGAAIKEYWDVHGLEDEQTSGGVKGSLEDFAFWLLGDALAVGTLLLRRA